MKLIRDGANRFPFPWQNVLIQRGASDAAGHVTDDVTAVVADFGLATKIPDAR